MLANPSKVSTQCQYNVRFRSCCGRADLTRSAIISSYDPYWSLWGKWVKNSCSMALIIVTLYSLSLGILVNKTTEVSAVS